MCVGTAGGGARRDGDLPVPCRWGQGAGGCGDPALKPGCCALRPAAMEEGMSSMQQKAAELEHMAEVLLTGEQLR